MANITFARDGVKKEQRCFTDEAGKIMAVCAVTVRDQSGPKAFTRHNRERQGIPVSPSRERRIQGKNRLSTQLGIAPALARMQQASTRSLALLDGRPPSITFSASIVSGLLAATGLPALTGASSPWVRGRNFTLP